MILFILSFVAGILTVLAPCVLPLLPIIVGSSVAGESNKKKAITISAALGVSVILFTYLLKVSTFFIHIKPEVWAIISGVIIIIFGIVSIFPAVWESIPFISSLNIGSNKVLATGYKKESFWGDVIIGASLGPVFSTCSPTYFVILATVLPQSFFLGSIDLLAYAVGLSGSLLLIAFLGQKIVEKLGGISDTRGIWRRSLGVLFVIIGVLIIFGIDKKIEASLLSNGIFDITRVEQKLLSFNEKPFPGQSSNDENKEENNAERKISKLTVGDASNNTPGEAEKIHGPKAPEIVNPSGFINTDGKPVTLAQFKGKKVVLLDIWTYSCINCQRTLPYIKAWYEKYKEEGLVVIGIHTPEFAFEKVQKNVEDAVKRFGITYPVIMDNDYAIWTAYGNQYWPRKYLINANGEVIYDHIGEGGYEETEKEIQKALAELNGKDVTLPIASPKGVISVEPGKVASPEVYFGSSRNEYFGNGQSGSAGEQTLSLPNSFSQNKFYLEGTWNFSPEYTVNTGTAKIVFKYNSKNVYMVASSDKAQTVTILKDGKKEKTITVEGNKLYTLIEGDSYGEHTIEIDIPESGLHAFTFTFG